MPLGVQTKLLHLDSWYNTYESIGAISWVKKVALRSSKHAFMLLDKNSSVIEPFGCITYFMGSVAPKSDTFWTKQHCELVIAINH